MLNIDHPKVRERLFDGSFGLERETLRVTADGGMAHTLHPFDSDPYIVKDFCENQTEINTGTHRTAAGVIAELNEHTKRLYTELDKRSEYLWMFSNPPYIKGARDIPVALYDGELSGKQSYRMYLADKYGKYKMTLSGIHINYSFGEELLRADFELSPYDDYIQYKDSVYLSLAQSLAAYGWIINLLFAASPICDGSYFDPSETGKDRITGDASVRCSFDGYWNRFTPVFDYKDILSYAESIQKYIVSGELSSAGELYYPIRLKPRGSNRLNSLVQNGVNHIEIRNVDINPFAPSGIDERDLSFTELLVIYLTAEKDCRLSRQEQFFAAENFKRAARFDIDKESIRLITGETLPARAAGLRILKDMKRFYSSELFDSGIQSCADSVLDYQLDKLSAEGSRYAERVLSRFGGGFVSKGMEYIISNKQV